MPQEQQKKPQPKRPLTPEELSRFSDTKFTPSQLQLIWTRKTPLDANLDDLEMFLYVCENKGLNPLLGEVFCRLQFDKDTGELKLLILDSIHGMLKSADKTKELNGIETTIEVNDEGDIVSATAIVHRKGCEFPFRATAYWAEYNANTFIWRQKPRVMITKCATALALRLAFAEALAGVFAPEELEHSDGAPEPNSEFTVAELPSEVKTDVQRLDPDVSIDFTNGERGKYAGKVDTKDITIIPQDDPPKEKTDAPAMPINEVKQKNQALSQRVLLDLQIEKLQRIPLLSAYYRGWLNIPDQEPLPKDPTLYTGPLESLCRFSDATRGARIELVADAKGLGAKLRSDKDFERATA